MNDEWNGGDKICRGTGALSIEDMHYLLASPYGSDDVTPMSAEEIARMERDLELFLSKEKENGRSIRTGKLQPQQTQESDETRD